VKKCCKKKLPLLLGGLALGGVAFFAMRGVPLQKGRTYQITTVASGPPGTDWKSVYDELTLKGLKEVEIRGKGNTRTLTYHMTSGQALKLKPGAPLFQAQEGLVKVVFRSAELLSSEAPPSETAPSKPSPTGINRAVRYAGTFVETKNRRIGWQKLKDDLEAIGMVEVAVSPSHDNPERVRAEFTAPAGLSHSYGYDTHDAARSHVRTYEVYQGNVVFIPSNVKYVS
jgi:hypothetical protein